MAVLKYYDGLNWEPVVSALQGATGATGQTGATGVAVYDSEESIISSRVFN